MKTIIFDFDGTLAETLPLCFSCFRTVFWHCDRLELSDEQIVAMFGPTEEDIIRKHLRNRAQVEQAVAEFYRLYEQQHDAFVERQESIVDLLQTLRDRQFMLAVFTGKGRKSLEISLAKLNLASWFRMTVAGEDVVRAKPDPEGLFTLLNEMNVRPEEAVFVGDSSADITAGKAASLYTVGVQWMKRPQTNRFDPEPDAVCSSTDQFLQWLERR